MIKIIILAGLLLSLHFVGYAQQNESASFKLTDLSISTGLESNFGQASFDGFLLGQVSDVAFLPSDLSLYQQQDYYYSTGSGNYEVLAGFAWRASKDNGAKVNKRLRIGLSYSQPVLISDSYFRSENMPYDTLRSTRTGEEFYLDSTYYSNLDLNYAVTNLSLNTSLLWTTDDNARVAFYGGVNLSLHLNFGARINVHRLDYSYLANDAGYADYADFESKHGSFGQPSSFGFGFSSPIGLDWRVGKQGKALNDVHLFSEVRPGISNSIIPGYELISQFRASVHLGLRFSM